MGKKEHPTRIEAMAELVGDAVKTERTSRHWSQALVAEKTSMSESSLSRIENGEMLPTLIRLDALQELFGVKLLPTNDAINARMKLEK